VSVLNLLYNVLAYDDDVAVTNNNPSMRSPDFSRQYFGINVDNPQGQRFSIPPNSSLTLFDGTRTVNLSATGTYSITKTTGSTYRLTNTAGTAPAFRTARTTGIDATSTFNVAINNGALVTMSHTSGTSPNLTTAQAGDVFYVASTSPFNVLNEGYFTVLASTTTSLSFENANASAESNITLTTNFASEFRVFSNDNVQIGDTLVLNSGFSTVTQGTYEITAVNTDFIEFVSSRALPLEANVVVGATGITIYSNAKFFIHIEANQNCTLRLNGESTDNTKIEPFTLDSQGVQGIRGIYSKIGSTYRAVLVNKSPTTAASVFLFTAERP